MTGHKEFKLPQGETLKMPDFKMNMDNLLKK